jgi:hypothetical protein
MGCAVVLLFLYLLQMLPEDLEMRRFPAAGGGEAGFRCSMRCAWERELVQSDGLISGCCRKVQLDPL